MTSNTITSVCDDGVFNIDLLNIQFLKISVSNHRKSGLQPFRVHDVGIEAKRAQQQIDKSFADPRIGIAPRLPRDGEKPSLRDRERRGSRVLDKRTIDVRNVTSRYEARKCKSASGADERLPARRFTVG